MMTKMMMAIMTNRRIWRVGGEMEIKMERCSFIQSLFDSKHTNIIICGKKASFESSCPTLSI